MQRLRLNAARNMGFCATVSARALKVEGDLLGDLLPSGGDQAPAHGDELQAAGACGAGNELFWTEKSFCSRSPQLEVHQHDRCAALIGRARTITTRCSPSAMTIIRAGATGADPLNGAGGFDTAEPRLICMRRTTFLHKSRSAHPAPDPHLNRRELSL